MDREQVTKSSSQIGFIKFALLPLFEALGQLFPVIEVSTNETKTKNSGNISE
jgi:hypothetical protein